MKIGTERAMAAAFEGLDTLGATRTTSYDAEYIATRNERLRAAGYTVLS